METSSWKSLLWFQEEESERPLPREASLDREGGLSASRIPGKVRGFTPLSPSGIITVSYGCLAAVGTTGQSDENSLSLHKKPTVTDSIS